MRFFGIRIDFSLVRLMFIGSAMLFYVFLQSLSEIGRSRKIGVTPLKDTKPDMGKKVDPLRFHSNFVKICKIAWRIR